MHDWREMSRPTVEEPEMEVESSDLDDDEGPPEESDDEHGERTVFYAGLREMQREAILERNQTRLLARLEDAGLL